MKKLCCEDMKCHIYFKSEDKVSDNGDKEDKPIWYYSDDNEYGIPLVDFVGGFVSSYIVIKYCPWCGKRLK